MASWVMAGGPAVDTEREEYVIEGSSARELRAELDRKGPLDKEGVRHDAYTTWNVTWEYPYERRGDGCASGRVTVKVRIVETLPRWDPPPGTPDDLVRKWRTYLAALETHEDGHAQNGIDGAREVKVALEQIGAQETCDDFETRADRVGDEVMERHRQRDRSYDRETRSGATQGATFP